MLEFDVIDEINPSLSHRHGRHEKPRQEWNKRVLLHGLGVGWWEAGVNGRIAPRVTGMTRFCHAQPSPGWRDRADFRDDDQAIVDPPVPSSLIVQSNLHIAHVWGTINFYSQCIVGCGRYRWGGWGQMDTRMNCQIHKNNWWTERAHHQLPQLHSLPIFAHTTSIAIERCDDHNDHHHHHHHHHPEPCHSRPRDPCEQI